MRLATLLIDGTETVAQISPQGDSFCPALDRIGQPFASMSELIQRVSAASRDEITAALPGDFRPLAQAVIRAPLIPARNIMCVGKNYLAHAREFTQSGFDNSALSDAEIAPSAPIIFTKAPETVIATGESIRVPRELTQQADYEAELAVIIGKGGRAIARQTAMDHVFGYTIVNDVTARDLQAKHKQWFLGKSIDSFCPMGPWIATADAIDSASLDISCWVNGELRQQANTADLIFDIPTLIEVISASLTLKPGDVIATGTPAGVGIGFKPPRFLNDGDEVVIEIAGLGQLRNRVN